MRSQFDGSEEWKAVIQTRELGGDISEEFEAFRLKRQERHLLEAEVECVFATRGWK